MDRLQLAIEIAVEAHRGQKRNNGDPYILHPLRVMQDLMPLGKNFAIAGVLHDVIEDSSIVVEDLLENGFDPDIVSAVNLVSRDKTRFSYQEFIDRIIETYRAGVRCGEIARAVKMADLRDNMRFNELGRVLNDYELRRIRKYQRALRDLENTYVGG